VIRRIYVRALRHTRSAFWRDASAVEGSVMLHVLPLVLTFGAIACAIAYIDWNEKLPNLKIEVTAFELLGAALGALLVLRTNEGIGRWTEGRKLWGGITNQSRNIVAAGLAYGPDDEAWRRSLVRWTIVFAHACRRSLRAERAIPEIVELVGEDEARRVAEAEHMPGHVSLVLGRILRVAVDRLGMDRFMFLQIDQERMALIDHIGGCERISKTPLPRAYAIQIRQLLFAFLVVLPCGLIKQVGYWYTPLLTMVVAYPLLALDRIGAELQRPFLKSSLSHLDLDGITTTIERNLLGLLDGPAGDVEVDVLLVEDEVGATPPAPSA